MADDDELQLLTESVDLLDQALVALAGELPQPQLVGLHNYRYAVADEMSFALLRSVRLVSGFRAAIKLVQAGYLQETYVLLRTLVEFIHDLDLVIADFLEHGACSALQEKLNKYFSDDMRTPADMMADGKKPASMPRGKVYAAVGRSLNPEDPHRARQLLKVIEEVYSAYTHGAYPCIMQMYDGDRGCLSTAGMPHCLQEGLPAIAQTLQPALSGFADLASVLGLKKTADDLYTQRERTDKSALYQR